MGEITAVSIVRDSGSCSWIYKPHHATNDGTQVHNLIDSSSLFQQKNKNKITFPNLSLNSSAFPQ